MRKNKAYFKNISSEVLKVFPKVIKYRRHFHKNPELSLREYKTADFIERELTKLGLKPYRPIETGVVAVLDSGKGGRTVMLRADMDALPVSEENRHEYVSRYAGRMHACGHDAHMAMLLGLARIFTESGIPAGKVKFCFQPGEEGSDGAGKMVKAGVLRNPKVDFAYGAHVWSPLPTGSVAILSGPCMASVDEFEVTVRGSGGHAAYPHTAIDPVIASASIIQSLHTIVSRNVEPFASAVLTIASVNAGTAFNIIPEEASFKGTVRTFRKDVRKLIERRFKSIVENVARAYGCKATITYIPKVPATVNDEKMASQVRKIAEEMLGRKAVKEVKPTMGGEDFSRYANEVPAVFAFIGARNEKLGAKYPHHHPRFNIDEDALAIGMELARRVTLDLLSRE